ncbi:MAG: hypothetical protein K2K45_07420 [Muribaculaceae bacterium]|nr:hypothetical protein [Muribaculaceae bacterium]
MKKILMTLTLAMAAMIAIPVAANAQDTTTKQTAECCKKECNKNAACDKTECKKENCKNEECKKNDCKDCKKECSKPCMKDGKNKKGMRAHAGKKMGSADRRMMPPKDARMHKGTRHGRGENPMFKGITLSEDQQQKLKALRENRMAAEKNSKDNAQAKSKEEIQKLRADFDKEVEKILDKDQLKQYQANKAEIQKMRSQKRK